MGTGEPHCYSHPNILLLCIIYFINTTIIIGKKHYKGITLVSAKELPWRK
jgi:hypothetical protein